MAARSESGSGETAISPVKSEASQSRMVEDASRVAQRGVSEKTAQVSAVDVTPSWKPFALRWPFLTLLIAASLAQICFLGGYILPSWSRFQKEHFETDTSGQFIFDRDDKGAYFKWRFLSTMVQIILGLLWSEIDQQVRRMEPFYQLSRPGGASARDSLSMDYSTVYAFFCPLVAMYRKHYTIVISSTISLLSFTILPVFHDQMWRPKPLMTHVWLVEVSMAWTITVLVFTLAILILSITLTILLSYRQTGLVADPDGYVGLASLIHDSNVLQDFGHIPAYETPEYIDERLSNRRFWLQKGGRWSNNIQIVSGVDEQADPQATAFLNRPFKQTKWNAHPWPLWARTQILIELLFLAPVLAILLAAFNFAEYNQSWTPRTVQGLFFFLTTCSTAFWRTIDKATRMMQVMYTTRPQGKRYDDSAHQMELLLSDLEHVDPVTALFRSVRSAPLAFCTTTCVVLAQIITLLAPAMLLDFWTFPDDVTIPTFISEWNSDFQKITWAFSVPFLLTSIALIICRRRSIIPRSPSTLASKILYICHSARLLETSSGMSEMTTRERRIEFMRRNEDSLGYHFGWFVEVEEAPRREESAHGRFRRSIAYLGIDERPTVRVYTYGESSIPRENPRPEARRIHMPNGRQSRGEED